MSRLTKADLIEAIEVLSEKYRDSRATNQIRLQEIDELKGFKGQYKAGIRDFNILKRCNKRQEIEIDKLSVIEKKYNAVIKSKRTVETLVEANDSMQQRMREYHADRDNIRVLKDKNRQLDRANSHLQSELDIVSVMKGQLANDCKKLNSANDGLNIVINRLRKAVKYLNQAI